MIERYGLCTRNRDGLAPGVGVAVGARDHQPMQHGEVDGAFGIEAEMALTQMPLQHLTAAGRLPEPAKHQVGSNTAAMQFGQLAPVEARQHDRTAGVAGGGGDQAIEQIGVLHLVAPPQRLDNALHMAAALAGVLDEVEVFVRTDLLDADEHG